MEIPRKVAVDTDILIDHLRMKGGDKSLVTQLGEAAELATTMVNPFELYYGACKSRDVAKNATSAKGLLSTRVTLNLSDKSCEKTGEVPVELESDGSPIDPRDILIGTIAAVEGYAVLTKK